MTIIVPGNETGHAFCEACRMHLISRAAARSSRWTTAEQPYWPADGLIEEHTEEVCQPRAYRVARQRLEDWWGSERLAAVEAAIGWDTLYGAYRVAEATPQPYRSVDRTGNTDLVGCELNSRLYRSALHGPLADALRAAGAEDLARWAYRRARCH